MPKILIIDDEQDLIDLLSYNLEKEGYATITALNGIEGKKLAISSTPDLILLDLMLPGIDGLELCRMLRKEEKTSTIPIIMLTAKGEEIDKVLGLEMGADDYVTKPFGIREIVARVKAQLRRTTIDNKVIEVFNFNSLSIDTSTHEVTIYGKPIKLSPLEFNLLKFFVTHQERVYSRDQLLDYVWGDESFVEQRTVDVHIRRLREKIEPEGTKLIKTIRGAGYRFSTSNYGDID